VGISTGTAMKRGLAAVLLLVLAGMGRADVRSTARRFEAAKGYEQLRFEGARNHEATE
jgi:hypothetical protein